MTTNPSPQKVALVTGASSGFGALIAAGLAGMGYRVFGASRQPHAAGAPGAPSLEWLVLDVQSDASVAACFEQIEGAAGRLDVLVNNAGISHASAIEETGLDQARQVFETNFWGVVRMTQAGLPLMRRQRSGRLITIGSLAGLVPAVGQGFYSASKFALEGYCEVLSYEVAAFDIHVSLIEPGFYKTNIAAGRLTAAHTFSDYDALRRSVLETLKRSEQQGGDPAEVADAVVRAAENPHPPVHIRVGARAQWLPRLKAVLPDGLFRRGIRQNYRLP
jgi:NAD(P)-dependent dehydrogenase (short-subunit alcohol dehydrogenase family)